MNAYEKLGVFYLGREVDPASGARTDRPLLYDSTDLVTHAVIVGMTGSGKTGLGIALLEEAAMDRVPVIALDPKGDLGNLLLTFPALAPADFRPWIDETAAAAAARSADDEAANVAKTWREGLASWEQDGDRIRRLREAADFAIFTPGGTAGLPIALLRSLAAPPAAARADEESLRDRIESTVGGLLFLLGIEADPAQSREHILLSTLLDQAWREGRSLDLASLIREIQTPPVQRVGVLDLESFFPQGDRFALAMRVNNLLASPGFAAWRDGDPLDVDTLLRAGRQAARLRRLARAPRRRAADVLRHRAARRDRLVDAGAAGHLQPARGALDGRGVRLPAAHGEPAVQEAAAHAVEAGAGVRAGRGRGHAESRGPGLQSALERGLVVPRETPDRARRPPRPRRARRRERGRRRVVRSRARRR